jgi:hypothetical protein
MGMAATVSKDMAAMVATVSKDMDINLLMVVTITANTTITIITLGIIITTPVIASIPGTITAAVANPLTGTRATPIIISNPCTEITGILIKLRPTTDD